eukprot:NODE_2587_length_1142_cov_27.506404_g2467_i0.p1 GENE.NODE_2587_length_1142_cov_27.506404_g2467_i0~~NODE_2587_length_1142_cov_27.506404_g2467_i0.p1  ORF type:complete len:321 (-),score=65.36 NODE_2587_length_1142_cov_27.506404_g2467_i0:124-1086(-)
MGTACVINEPSEATRSPPKIINDEFWIAGSVPTGQNGVPLKGPFRDESVPPQSPSNRICFSTLPIDSVVPSDFTGTLQFAGADAIHARPFFPHCLPAYCVGWAKLELSPEHPHYNCRKHREREKEKERLGIPIDYSRRKKYYIYPERVSELGLFLTVDGKKIETEVAVSKTSWPAEKIPGAFFTFTPANGSVFGENSFPLPLHPEVEDEIMKDKRWLSLSIQMDRVITRLSPGVHEFRFEIKYRYGNTKFTAWRGTENDKGVYRYSDEDRSESLVSEAVAVGAFTWKCSSDDLKSLKQRQETSEGLLRTLVEGDTEAQTL